MELLQSPELAAIFLRKESEYEQVVSALNQLPKNVRKLQLALYKLSVLSEASWRLAKEQLDWTNEKQKKYYPWFNLSPGLAYGFSCLGCNCVGSLAYVSSSLVFPTKEAAVLIGETYIDLYLDLMILIK